MYQGTCRRGSRYLAGAAVNPLLAQQYTNRMLRTTNDYGHAGAAIANNRES